MTTYDKFPAASELLWRQKAREQIRLAAVDPVYQDDTGKILGIAGLMFVSTFFVGMIPLFCKCNPVLKDAIAVYGGGLLIGAALAIILPEGMIVLLVSFLSSCGQGGHAHKDEHGHVHPEAVLTETNVLDTEAFGKNVGLALAGGFAFMLIADQLMVCYKESKQTGENNEHVHTHDRMDSELSSPMRAHSEHSHHSSPQKHRHHHGHDHEHHTPTKKDAAVNLSGEDDDGFRHVKDAKMKKVKTDEEEKEVKGMAKKSSVTTSKSCAQNPSSTWHLHHHHHDHDHMDKEQRRFNKVLAKVENQEQIATLLEDYQAQHYLHDETEHPSHHHHPKGTVQDSADVITFGLVIHSITDGLSLGVSVFLNSIVNAQKNVEKAGNDIGLVMFLAILVHKVPATIGLSSTLLHANLESKTVMKHVLVFTLTAPVVAVLSYLILSNFGLKALGFGSESKEGQNKSLGAGVGSLLLFSAGTFLYVSTIHILPEVYCKPSTEENCEVTMWMKLRTRSLEVIVVLAGLFTPFLLH